MIAGHVVDDDRVLARLRAMPSGITSGLASAITNLGIELQQKASPKEFGGYALKARSGSLESGFELRVDQDTTAVTATVFTRSEHARVAEYGFAGAVDVKASLRRITKAFRRPIAEKSVGVPPYRRKMALPERSFLRSALEEMAPTIRSDVETALGQALTE